MQRHRSSIKDALWITYFLILALAWFASLFIGSHSLESALLCVFSGLGLVGLWGYINCKAIGGKLIWIGYFLLMVAGFLYSVVATIAKGKSDPLFAYGLLTAVAITNVPQWYALWRYAFQSDGLWQNRSSA